MRENRPAGEGRLHFATLWEAIADEIPVRPGPDPRGTDDRVGGIRAASRPAGRRAPGPRPRPGQRRRLLPLQLPRVLRDFPGRPQDPRGACQRELPLRRRRVRALLENCEAEALIYDSALRERVASVRHEVPGVRLLVELGEDARGARLPGACEYCELIASSEQAPRVSRSERDVFLSYTGGTTGLPKGVRYTIGRSMTTRCGCAICSSAQAPTSGSSTTRRGRPVTVLAWSPSRRRRSCTAPGSRSPRSPR